MSIHKRQILIGGALAATASLALAGCAGGGGGNGGGGGGGGGGETGGASAGSLTVWVDANRAEALEGVAADFTEESGVDVELVQKDFGEIQEQFIAQVPTGEGPDITIGAHDWLGNLVTNGVVAPVELGDTAGDFQQVAIDAVTFEGQIYGVPYSIENIALVRNTELAPEAPETYDEMLAMGEEAGTEFPFIVQVGPESDPYHLYPFQTSFGAPVFGQNEDGTYNPEELSLGNEGGVEFANWLAEQGEAGNLNLDLTGELAIERFNAGDSPFIITGPWNVPAAQEAGIDVAIDPIPSAGGEPAQPFVGVNAFFVSAESENQLAANEFLSNYLGTEEVQTALYEAGGRAPANTAAFEAASSDPIVGGFGAVGAEAVPMPNIPEMGKVWAFWGVTEASIIKGDGDPADLWGKMTADVEAAISE
jgi:arabinogalactan oligomer/maltooligosaccharide transport system substrate-binding protein